MSCLSPWIWVNPVVEVKETADTGRRVSDSPEEESVKFGVELPVSTACLQSLSEDIVAVQTTTEADTREALAFLEHLNTCLHEVHWLRLYV